MLSSNPFTERTFYSSSVHTELPKERKYFPYSPRYYTRPGFLMPAEEGFPKITSESRSAFWKPNMKKESQVRNHYVQNPFHKSHLLEDSQYMSSSSRLYSSHAINNYGYGSMSESRVRPVQIEENYNDSKKYFSPSSETANFNKQRNLNDDNPENIFSKRSY